jgi:hypothetical protein
MSQPRSDHRGSTARSWRGEEDIEDDIRLTVDSNQHLSFQFVGTD